MLLISPDGGAAQHVPESATGQPTDGTCDRWPALRPHCVRPRRCGHHLRLFLLPLSSESIHLDDKCPDGDNSPHSASHHGAGRGGGRSLEFDQLTLAACSQKLNGRPAVNCRHCRWEATTGGCYVLAETARCRSVVAGSLALSA
jgi:hypothetical protein